MDISVEALRSIVPLVDKKEDLQKQLSEIDSQISALLAGKPPVPALKAPKVSRKARAGRMKAGKRGGVREAVIAALTVAGPAGMTVGDLAKVTGTKPDNLFAWFNSTGKNIPGMAKVGRGQWALADGHAVGNG